MLELHTARARLHRSRAAVPRELGRAARDGQPAEVRAGSVQDRGRLGSLPDPDRGSPAHEPVSRRDPRRAAAAAALHRLHAVLPQRSGLLRRRRARPDPAASVRQGGAGEVHDAGTVVRRAGEADRERRGSAEAPGAALPDDAAVHRRHGLCVREDLRYRGLAAEPEDLSRDLVLQQHDGVPGAAGEHQVPARTGPARSNTSTR